MSDLPGSRLLELVTVLDTLRTRCPWDRAQTHASLAKYLIEEAYEAVEAIETDDARALREELGDVLLQVVFHARVAAERQDDTGFTIDDVAGAVVEKMVRRHPHVFADVEVSGTEDVTANWETIKAAERASKDGDAASALDGVPIGQPALALAAAVQRRAARSGVPEDLISHAVPGLGGHLFDLVTRAREADEDAETELRAAARAFRERVRAAESAARTAGHVPGDLTAEQWRCFWPE